MNSLCNFAKLFTCIVVNFDSVFGVEKNFYLFICLYWFVFLGDMFKFIW